MSIVCKLIGHQYIVIDTTETNNPPSKPLKSKLIKKIVSWWVCTRCNNKLGEQYNLYEKEDFIK